MAIRQTRGVWQIDAAVHVDGKLRRKRKRASVQTKAGAQAEHDQIVRHLRSGRSLEVDPGIAWGAFLGRAVEHLQASSRASCRVQVRSETLGLTRHIPASTPLQAVGQRHYDVLIDGLLAEALAPTTIQRYQQRFKRTLKLAAAWGYIVSAPTITTRRLSAQRQRVEGLTDQEVVALLGAMAGQMRAMVQLVLHAGVRAAELRGLHWQDVHWERRQLLVRRTEHRGKFYPTKGSSERAIPLTDDLVALLRHRLYADLQDGEQLKSTLLFTDRKGRPYKGAELSALLRVYYRSSGVEGGLAKGYRPWHILRHTFATRLYQRGVPVPTIQRLLGHARIETTMGYLHVSESDCRMAIAHLDQDRTVAPPHAAPATERDASVFRLPVERVAYR